MADKPVNAVERSSSTAQKALVYLVLVALFALLFNLGGRPIEFKDYLRYAEVAREILQLDDWVMLHEQGKIYVDKPPLQFWLTATAYQAFGVTPFAARLPSATAAFCGVLVTFFFARRIFGSTQTAFLAAIVLLSAYDYLWWARRTRIDMLFGVLFSVSLICFYCGCQTAAPRKKTLWYLAFWLATGLAFMDKAFIAFSNLAVVVSYGIFITRRPEGRTISPARLALTSPVLLLVTLPWIIALVHHPQFSDFWQILKQTRIMDRQEAFYFYLVQMPLKLLPATPFVVMGIWGFLRYRRQIPEKDGLQFALLWVLSIVLILHLTVAKSTRYLLPVYLPCALLGAWALPFFLQKTKALGIILHGADRFLLTIVSLGTVSPLVVAYFYGVSPIPALLYSAAMAAALVAARRFLPYKTAGFFVSFILMLLLIDAGDTVVREKVSVYYRMNRAIKMQQFAPDRVVFYKCYSRAQTAMEFYFNRPMACSDDWRAIASNPQIRAIVTTRDIAEAKITSAELENPSRTIPCDDKWIIIIKPDR